MEPASATYQIEGVWNEDCKEPSVGNVYTKIPGKTFKGTNGDIAVNNYHRYKENAPLMAEMGLKAYRYFPTAGRGLSPSGKGEINEAGLAFYDYLIDELLSHNSDPVLTLYHWDMPQALMDEYGALMKQTMKVYKEPLRVILSGLFHYTETASII